MVKINVRCGAVAGKAEIGMFILCIWMWCSLCRLSGLLFIIGRIACEYLIKSIYEQIDGKLHKFFIKINNQKLIRKVYTKIVSSYVKILYRHFHNTSDRSIDGYEIFTIVKFVMNNNIFQKLLSSNILIFYHGS